MMISVGYYFDQVSRERMVQRISAQVELIADVDADRRGPVDQDTTCIWIETAHPVYHELDDRPGGSTADGRAGREQQPVSWISSTLNAPPRSRT